MVTTPTSWIKSEEEGRYRGLAMSQMRILQQQLALGRLNMGTRVIRLDNGVVITCTKCFAKEDVHIHIPPLAPVSKVVVAEKTYTGIIMHPRSGSIEMLPYTEYVSGPFGSMPETKYLPGVAGGWRDGKTELTTEYIYPLVDVDNASFLISKEDNEEELLGEFLGENGNYGNLYWWNGDEEEPVFLSWKGTPTRHFRLPGNIEIPGFSLFETSTPGATEDTPVYTTFGTRLYQGGSVLAEAPNWSWPYNGSGVGGRCLILGACQDTQGATYIVTQSDHYNAPENVFIFSDGHREEGADSLKQTYLNGKDGITCVFEKALTKPGFFLTLWRLGGTVNGWTLISETAYSRTGLPWFANASGTEFVSSNGDTLSVQGSFVACAPTKGTWKETNTGNSVATLEINSNYSGSHFYEYLFNAIAKNAVATTFSSRSNFFSTKSTSKVFTGLPLYVPPTEPLTLVGSDTYPGGTYNASGGQGPYSWAYPTGSCGMGTITVTDACGDTASIQVRLPNGYWKPYSSFNCGIWADYNTSGISGDTKREVGVGRVNNCSSVMAPCWSIWVGRCIDDCVQLCVDNGFPSWTYPPSLPTNCTEQSNCREGDACRPTSCYTTYCVTAYESVYKWTCP